jgi:SPP1 gp7 family putative phage head morphogenesis protein
MAKKPKINKDIREAGKAVAEIMKEHLTEIAHDMIQQVVNKYKRLPESQNLNAISGLSPRGTRDYQDALKTALSVAALDALNNARKEVPNKKGIRLHGELRVDNIQLGEFERLPPKLQKKIQTTTQLLIGKQLGDLQKVIEFAYATAEEETDSEEQIMSDLNDSAIGWLDGTAIEAGASLNAATIINSARNAFFFDDSVLEEVDAFEFVNGDPVTPICQDLAGTVFAKDDPSADRYFPPLHWNCKSYILPILKGNLGDREIEKLKPSTKSLDDEVQFSEKLEQAHLHRD